MEVKEQVRKVLGIFSSVYLRHCSRVVVFGDVDARINSYTAPVTGSNPMEILLSSDGSCSFVCEGVDDGVIAAFFGHSALLEGPMPYLAFL